MVTVRDEGALHLCILLGCFSPHRGLPVSRCTCLFSPGGRGGSGDGLPRRVPAMLAFCCIMHAHHVVCASVWRDPIPEERAYLGACGTLQLLQLLRCRSGRGQGRCRHSLQRTQGHQCRSTECAVICTLMITYDTHSSRRANVLNTRRLGRVSGTLAQGNA